MKEKINWRQFGLGFCMLYSLAIFVYFGLRTFLIDWPSWLTLLSSFAPFLFVPALLVLLLAWKIHSKIGTVLSIFTLALFIFAYGSLFVPHMPIASAGIGREITVMTMNLGPGVATPDHLVAEIENADADIIAVQEMTSESAGLLATRLRGKYPYLILDADVHSTGLLSRFPIHNPEWFQLANEGRAALYTEIDVTGSHLHLFAPHPLPSNVIWWEDRPLPIGVDDSPQQRQLTDVVQRVQKIGTRVIVLGDLNVSDQTRVYPVVANHLRDAYREVGWGFGFTFPNGLRVENLLPSSGWFGSLPVPGPLLRLDYVFHSDDMIAESAQVVCRGGSDHCYLIVRLGIQ